ncbi:heterokaryon incompatibility protein-domain-containing protein [Ilyonectria destructans]|nr:heterokaryon incompatibility protein-domain-containing protein [Ilyonectria destructans]
MDCNFSLNSLRTHVRRLSDILKRPFLIRLLASLLWGQKMDITQRGKFQYNPLAEDRMIRLLGFLPGRSPLAKLVSVKLNEAPPYAALSYTWGANIFDRTLNLEGGSLQITQNLLDCLTALSDEVREGGFWFWIDAVCINQDDQMERSSQVGFMDLVYKSAQRVFVWLGKSDAGSDVAMDTIRDWSTVIQSSREGHRELTSYRDAIEAAPSGAMGAFSGAPGSHEHGCWMNILSLWNRPWWSRAWVVQEATALPVTETVLCCGNRRIDLHSMRVMIDLRYQLIIYSDSNDFLMTTFEQGFAELLDNINANLAEGPKPFHWVLQQVRTYECKDARDKVYASMNMASDVPRGAIMPNYTRDLADVYIDAVRQLVAAADEQHRLDFLGYVFRPTADWARLALPDHPIMPTWVPDWRGPKTDVLSFKKYLDIHRHTESPRAYAASLDTSPRMSIAGRSLHIGGVRLDSITVVKPISTSPRISDTTIEQAWEPDDPNQTYPRGGSLGAAYNHAMLADLSRIDDISSHTTPFQRGIAVDWPLINAPAANLSDTELRRRKFMLNDLKSNTLGRRIFSTANGLVGLGPGAAQVGDRVCLFLGGQMLYIIRETGNGIYQFAGECYVHGFMDGEGLSGANIETFIFV